MTKYQPLRTYLESRQDLQKVRLTFSEIATILGEPLPPSAFQHKAWWANPSDTTYRAWAAAWLDAGFRVADFQQEATDGWVEFERIQA